MGDGRILNSWKEISQYVGRGVRTIQRYEHSYSFPVRRVAGRARTSVMALTDEIDAWVRHSPLLQQRNSEEENPIADSARQLHGAGSTNKLLLKARNPERIWLIEDDPSYVETFGAVLRKLGPYQMSIFANSSDALKAFADLERGNLRAPALIVLDYELSGESGFEVLTRYRNAPELRSAVPLIVWSVLDNLTTREMSMWMGAKTFISKQIGARVLSRTLQSLLSSQTLAAGPS